MRPQPGGHPFVGREHELGVALALLEEALGGRGQVLLIAGEPGIGKSRMADEIATRARKLGAQVAWGRCWEAGGAPPYWPWVQSLRSLARDLTPDDLRTLIGPAASDIAQLLPELPVALGEVTTPPALDPATARFRLFDSSATFLKNAARARPLVLILDDLHAADAPSLLLLRFVASALTDASILIVGAYRDTEVRPDHPLASALVELARGQAVCRLTLHGLAEADVSRVMTLAAGFTPQEHVVSAVHDQTEGNPLYLGEVIRLLLEEGRLDVGASEAGSRLSVPQSVRDVIGLRLQHLPEACVDLLRTASVLGREFSLEALSQLSSRTFDDTLTALDAAFSARVVTDVPGTNSRLRFAHVVIRESLYDDIGNAHRIQLHRRAANVLETVYGDDLESHLAELAHHHVESALGGDVATATRYARRAGNKAVELLAYEEAIRLYQMALQCLELGSIRDPIERCELLLALGDAQTRAADEPASKRTFLEAADLSRSLGLPEQMARAALGYGGRSVWGRAGGDAHVIALLEEALANLAGGAIDLRVRLMARLGGALRDDPRPEPRQSISKRAVDLARRHGDASTLAYALEGLYGAVWRPDNAEERLSIATESVAVGSRAGDRERVLAAHQHRSFPFLELGDLPAVYRELHAIDRLTEELRQPTQRWPPANMRAMLALFEGRFEEAERWIQTAFTLRARTNRSDARLAHALQMFQLTRAQGRLAEVAELVRHASQQLTWYPVLRCAHALLTSLRGDQDLARVEFDDIAAGDFAALPFDNKWLFSISLLSEVAYSLAEPRRATVLYEKLLPFAARNAVAGGDGCTGSVSRYLGLMAVVMNRSDDAADHFERGLAHNARMGARPWVALTQYDFAVLLVGRDALGDRQRALDLLSKALIACDELGMPALRVDVVHALARVGVAVPTDELEPGPGQPAAARATVAVEDGAFRLEGEYWTVGYAGRLVRLRDSKGLRVLAHLLASPGRPHPALDLERLGASGDEITARAVAAGDAGDLIDDEARAAYRGRLRELRAALDDAGGSGDADGLGAMHHEIDFITRELGRALGLGGRSRRAGSIAERARLNVTRAVKASMRRIAVADPELAAHLEATVHTGTICEYTPDPRAAIEWRISLRGVRKS